MSHLTKMQMKITKMPLATRIARKFGWTITREAEYVDAFQNGMNNCHVFRDLNNKVRMLVGADGTVVTDSYYMGYDYQQFLQEYASEYIKEQAIMEGAQFVDKGLVNGQRIIEVEYA
jgi:hypothetical protein